MSTPIHNQVENRVFKDFVIVLMPAPFALIHFQEIKFNDLITYGDLKDPIRRLSKLYSRITPPGAMLCV